MSTVTSDTRASWSVKDEATLDELIDLMNLSPAECGLLGALQPAAEALVPELVEGFYARLRAHPNTAEYLRDTKMERQHEMVGSWFSSLFCGRYDAEYARKRLVIGAIHVRIGLPVRYPLAMLDLLMAFGERIAAQAPDPAAALIAIRKMIALDVAIFNQAYEDNQLKHLAEVLGGERLARRLLSGAV